ncbi:hypothetical protein Tco_0543187 [Tanacetum coccineum]
MSLVLGSTLSLVTSVSFSVKGSFSSIVEERWNWWVHSKELLDRLIQRVVKSIELVKFRKAMVLGTTIASLPSMGACNIWAILRFVGTLIGYKMKRDCLLSGVEIVDNSSSWNWFFQSERSALSH